MATETVIGFIAGIFVALILFIGMSMFALRSVANKVRSRSEPIQSKVEMFTPLISAGIVYLMERYDTYKKSTPTRRTRRRR